MTETVNPLNDGKHVWHRGVNAWPDGWRVQLPNVRRMAYFTSVLGLGFLAFLLFISEVPDDIVVALAGMICCGGLGAIAWEMSLWNRTKVEAWSTREVSGGREVTIVRVSRSFLVVHATTLAVFAAVSFVAPGVLGPIEGGTPRGQARMDLILPILPFAGAVAAGYVVLLLIAAWKFLGIGISSDGVYHWSWGGCSFYPWDDIRRVQQAVRVVPGVWLWLPQDSHHSGNPEESLLGRTDWFRRKKNSWLPLGTLAVHPILAYVALAFYHKHPELRHELGTDAALERARSANYPDVIEQLDNSGERIPEWRRGPVR